MANGGRSTQWNKGLLMPQRRGQWGGGVRAQCGEKPGAAEPPAALPRGSGAVSGWLQGVRVLKPIKLCAHNGCLLLCEIT